MMLSEDTVSKINELWKSISGLLRYDSPVLSVFFKANGDPAFVSHNDRMPTTAVIETLPAGMATESKQDTANTTLGNILAAVSARFSFAETIWQDSATPPAFWVRQTYQTNGNAPEEKFTLPDGTVGSPTGTVVPAASANTFTSETEYDVIANGMGYSIGDVLTKATLKQLIGGAYIDTFWHNQTTDTVIAKANIDMAKLQRANEQIAITSTALGGIADSQATDASSSWSVIALLKGLWTNTKVAFGAGNVDTTTQRVTLSNDDVGVASLESVALSQSITLVTAQNITITAASTQTAAVNASTKRIVVTAFGNDCWIKMASNPTATVAGTDCIPLTDGVPSLPYTVPAGTKVAVIADSATGYLNVQEIL